MRLCHVFPVVALCILTSAHGAELSDEVADEATEPWVGYEGHFACRTFEGLDRQLCAAVSDAEAEAIPRLIRAGANVDARSNGSHTKGMTILQVGVWYRWSIESIRLLIDAGADVNSRDYRGNPALVLATQTSPQLDPVLVDLLIRAGADVNAAGEKGRTPLMYAAMHDKTADAIEQLLTFGASVSAKDETGWTALMHATRRTNPRVPVLKTLLEAGANANAAHRYGGTALSIAAFRGNAQDVDLLIRLGANVNAYDHAGLTPLICAALGGHSDVATLLIEAGANGHARDRLGRTASYIAKLRTDGEMTTLLAGAAGRRSHAVSPWSARCRKRMVP